MTGEDLPRTLTRDLARRAGARVRVCGWVQETRTPAGGWRVVLRDHTGLAELSAERLAGIEVLPAEAAIEAVGTVEAADAPGDTMPRVAVESLVVSGPAARPLPLGDGSPLEARLDWRYLDLRNPRNRLVFEVQTTAERAMRDLWRAREFMEIHSPKLRALPNKSGGELFAVEYFGRRVYLAQSPQWYKQMAMAAGFDRVFEIAPVFRPQRVPTSRHDTEFTSVDVEMSWIRSDDDVMAFHEEMLVAVVTAVAAEHRGEVARWFGVDLQVPSRPFPRMTLDEAKAVVRLAGGSAADEDEDLDPDGERRLAEHIQREHGHELVFVTEYPEMSRPYYHMRRAEDSVATRSFDLLWRGLEISSGAQREHRYEQLVAQATARGVAVDRVRQYLEFFRFGCPPHGGFGMGLTRMLMSLLRVGDVREVTYVFRGPDRVTP